MTWVLEIRGAPRSSAQRSPGNTERLSARTIVHFAHLCTPRRVHGIIVLSQRLRLLFARFKWFRGTDQYDLEGGADTLLSLSK